MKAALQGRARILTAFVAAFLIAAAVVPRIDVGSYRENVQAALENALGRRVEISSVRFRLLPRPGFTVNDVTIGEDPAIGSEPVAYVGLLRATPGLLALLSGRLEFASIDLDDASLNLTRDERGGGDVPWNFSSLLQPRLLAAFPSVHMHEGRLNFKFGETKSIFYLLNTDVDLWPPSSAAAPWTLRVHAEPARTDRTARGFGSFAVRGEWRPRDSSTVLDVQLEKSVLGDMLTLFNGYESGVQGSISGNVHLAGPVKSIGLTGRVAVANLHGWNQTPPGGDEWPLDVSGLWNASGQTLDLFAKVAGAQAPISARYRVADYLGRPRWGVNVSLHGFPLAPLAGVARNLGWSIPAAFHIDGRANGSVSYSIPDATPRMDGQLSMTNSTLAVAGNPPLRIANADLQFAGTMVRLPPAAIVNDRNETAMLEGTWDSGTRTFEAGLSSDGMTIASLGRQISIAGIPLLSQATDGTWQGRLRYSSAADAGWTGHLRLKDTVIPFEAFAEPVKIAAADAVIDENGLSMKDLDVSIGGLRARAAYQYQPGAARPHKFRAVLTEASAAAIEKLMMPALHRGNFFTYAFNFGRAPAPNWLRNMRADGTVQIASFDLAGNEFRNVRSRVVWDGMQVRLAGLQTRFGAGAFTGDATVQLDRRQPSYELAGKLTGMPWRSGTIDAEGTVASSGTGSDLLDHLRAKGSFEGEGIDLTPLDGYDAVAGAFDWGWSGRGPRLHLTQLVMKSGVDTLQGTADTLDNGEVVLKLTDGTKHIQAAGAILQGEGLKVTP